MLRKTVLSTLLATTTVVSFSSQAAERMFSLDYSGTTYTASGTIGLDDAFLRNPGGGNNSYNLPSAAFTSLSLTVFNGTIALDTFTLADFNRIRFDTGGVTLDLSQELVGQSGWGNATGDFNLFGNGDLIAFGRYTFNFCDQNLGCSKISLSSFAPQIALAGMTLADAQASIQSTDLGLKSILSSTNIVVNGAHSRPMSRRVAAGEKTFWLAGDWGNDNHGARSGETGLAEVGGGYNFGQAQVNVSIGKTWAHQDLINGGDVSSDGNYVMLAGIIPLSVDNGVYATLGAFRHWGEVDIDRGYFNMGAMDHSSASPDSDTWGIRARVDWENAFIIKTARFSPYADLWHSETKLDSYTETGGGFPARFDSRRDSITELRAGLNTAVPIQTSGFDFVANVEAVHRFDDKADNTSGQVVGLFGFNLDGEKYDQNWFKGGIGIEGKLGRGKASLMLNGTTKGEMASSWLAASYQLAF